jgi:hypothetical protein
MPRADLAARTATVGRRVGYYSSSMDAIRKTSLLRRAVLGAGALAVLAVAAPQAGAATLTLAPETQAVTYGSAVRLSGRFTEGGAPIPDQDINLAAARLPGTGPLRTRMGVLTQGDGSFLFSFRPDVSLRLRALSPNPPAESPFSTVYTVPRLVLRYRYFPRTDRLIESLTAYSPRNVRLRGYVYTYLSHFGARRLPFRGLRALRYVRPGVSRMTARFTLPASWSGGWSFRTCYDAPRSSGMDDPRDRCTRQPIRPI